MTLSKTILSKKNLIYEKYAFLILGKDYIIIYMKQILKNNMHFKKKHKKQKHFIIMIITKKIREIDS